MWDKIKPLALQMPVALKCVSEVWRKAYRNYVGWLEGERSLLPYLPTPHYTPLLNKLHPDVQFY
jgi:hypothetical protein